MYAPAGRSWRLPATWGPIFWDSSRTCPYARGPDTCDRTSSTAAGVGTAPGEASGRASTAASAPAAARPKPIREHLRIMLRTPRMVCLGARRRSTPPQGLVPPPGRTQPRLHALGTANGVTNASRIQTFGPVARTTRTTRATSSGSSAQLRRAGASGARGDVHDVPAPLRQHWRERGAGEEEHPRQVDIEQPAPFRRRHFVGGSAPPYPGIVHDGIEATSPLPRPSHRRGGGGFIGDVALDRRGPRLSDRFYRAHQVVVRSRHQDHPRAGLRQIGGHRPPDPTARARHDDHLPRELRRHPPPPPIPPAGACTGDARSQGPVPCTVESVPVNRRILAALSYGHFATDLSQGAIPALLPVFKALFHLSYAGVGFIVLMANISSSVIQPAFGVLSDRIGMRWLMPVGALLAGVGMTLAVLSPHYALTIFLILISGLGVAAFHPEGYRYAGLAAGQRRATGMSYFSVGGNIGYGFGPAAASLALGSAGVHGIGYLLIFSIPAAILLWQVISPRQ